MSRYRLVILSGGLLFIALVALACNMLRPRGAAWTPPLATLVSQAEIMPVATPTVVEPLPGDQANPAAAETPVIATDVPADQPGGPQTLVITDADLAKEIASGVAGQNGLDATNLQVHFTGGKVRITADRLTYSFVQVDNFTLAGRLEAQDGALQLLTESVSPEGLVTSMIPSLANQALRKYAAQWYIEQVRTSEGQIALTVR